MQIFISIWIISVFVFDKRFFSYSLKSIWNDSLSPLLKYIQYTHINEAEKEVCFFDAYPVSGDEKRSSRQLSISL